MTGPVLTNWNHSAESRPDAVVEPASVAALQAIVTSPGTRTPIRPAGEMHSVNPCFAADGGTQVRMDHFRGCTVDAAARTVTVGARTTLLEITRALRPHGLELPVSPEIGNATAGSVACSGTKDASLFERPPVAGDEPTAAPGFGQVGSAVTQVKMVDAAGRDVTVSGEALRAIRSSYGLTGIIYEVTFRAEPAVPLRYSHQLIEFEGTPPSIEAIFDGAEAVLGFLEPYRPAILVERRRRAPGARIGPDDELKRRIRDFLWEWGASGATTVLTGLGKLLDPLARPLSGIAGALLPSLGDLGRLAGVERLVRSFPGATHLKPSQKLLSFFDEVTPEVLIALDGFTAFRSDSNVDFTRDRTTFFDFTFWAYPVRSWPDVVPAYINFCRERQSSFRPALFTEVYFIAADDRSLLPFAPTEHAFTLDVVHNEPTSPKWHDFNEQYNRFAAAHGGRPLLNQTKQLDRTPDLVAKTLPAWPGFKADLLASPAGARFLQGSFFAHF